MRPLSQIGITNYNVKGQCNVKTYYTKELPIRWAFNLKWLYSTNSTQFQDWRWARLRFLGGFCKQQEAIFQKILLLSAETRIRNEQPMAT